MERNNDIDNDWAIPKTESEQIEGQREDYIKVRKATDRAITSVSKFSITANVILLFIELVDIFKFIPEIRACGVMAESGPCSEQSLLLFLSLPACFFLAILNIILKHLHKKTEATIEEVKRIKSFSDNFSIVNTILFAVVIVLWITLC